MSDKCEHDIQGGGYDPPMCSECGELLVDIQGRRIRVLQDMAWHVISNILTDAQLDTRLPCGKTIRSWSKLLNK
jgi:hypothetical protein